MYISNIKKTIDLDLLKEAIQTHEGTVHTQYLADLKALRLEKKRSIAKSIGIKLSKSPVINIEK